MCSAPRFRDVVFHRATGSSQRSAMRRLAAFCASAGLCACTVGPDFHRPDATSASSYTAAPLAASTVAADGSGGAAQRFVPTDVPGDGWWRAFGSPTLNALVQQALDDS